ncbi:YbaB/EbfC family nucleoid-associated protein [Actinomadura sp. 21ATH]|uniref:YbaB/EbfC family nucleoid-associated protein n=1 Tax=Actinomadura sp. 21ATH TaxID=1735444 RepID=UPI0035BFE44A
MGLTDSGEFHQAQRMRELLSEVASRRFMATSHDGLVTVSAVATGQVVGLQIDPRVYRNPNSRALAESILETIDRAIAGATETHLDSLVRVSGVEASTFSELLESATNMVSELMEEVDDLQRRE